MSSGSGKAVGKGGGSGKEVGRGAGLEATRSARRGSTGGKRSKGAEGGSKEGAEGGSKEPKRAHERGAAGGSGVICGPESERSGGGIGGLASTVLDTSQKSVHGGGLVDMEHATEKVMQNSMRVRYALHKTVTSYNGVDHFFYCRQVTYMFVFFTRLVRAARDGFPLAALVRAEGICSCW
eukprot:1185231-Prorocentrum_minimum.AAC.3